MSTDPYGGFTAAFTFTNNTAKDLKDLRAGVVCYDAAGTIIGGASEYPALVAAAKPIRNHMKLTVSSKPGGVQGIPDSMVMSPSVSDIPARASTRSCPWRSSLRTLKNPAL